MKRTIYFALLAACGLGLASCSNEEDLFFDQTAAERLNAANDIYCARLGAQPNGWAMQFYPTYRDEAPFGAGFLVLMDFDPDHSVKVCMNNSLTFNQYKEDRSGWDIITDNGPVLTFNTHNSVMHMFSDPEDLPSTGDKDHEMDETGEGMGGDFEFVIVDAPEDASYMMLKGKKSGTYNLLTPIEEGVDYAAYLDDVNAFQAKMFSKTSPSFCLIHYADSAFVFADAGEGLPAIYPIGGDKVTQSGFNPFIITKRGDDYYLRFRDKKNVDGIDVQDYKYLADRDIFQSTENPACYLDGDNPSRFLNETLATNGSAWICSSKSETSEAFSALVSELAKAYDKRNYTYQNFSLSCVTDKLFLRVSLKKKKGGATNMDYVFTAEQQGDDIALTYVGPNKPDGQTQLDALPALQAFVDFFKGEFAISAATTKFDLSTLRLTSKTNPEMWFEFTKK